MIIGLTYNLRSTSSDTVLASPSKRAAAGPLALTGDDGDEEYDSPQTIEAVAAALVGLGHEVELLGDGEPLLRRLLDGPRPELVWNMAEGKSQGRSREARVPAVLEMLGIPYTGSDPLTLSAALDKDCAKRLVEAAGVATPGWVVFEGDWSAVETRLASLRYPLFAKPSYEGSSKGIVAGGVLERPKELKPALEQLFEEYRQSVLVEEFIDGDELTVGLVGNSPPDVLGIMRVLPKVADGRPFVYSLEVKRDYEHRVRYECPAPLGPRDTERVRQAALNCWSALGCRDVARLDFRLRDGVPYFLEANPLPGLAPITSDLVMIAGYVGVEHGELIGLILNAACERLNLVCESSLRG